MNTIIQISNSYKTMLSHSKLRYSLGLATKHHTYDSVFYIHHENGYYKAYKFYHDGVDIRIGTANDSAAEAYTEALCML